MMRSSFSFVRGLSNLVKPESPRAIPSPSSSPRVSYPVDFNSERKIKVHPESWLAQYVFDHPIQMAYQNFLNLKSLMASKNEAENLKTIETFYHAAQIFEIIEQRLGTVTPQHFFERDKNGDIKFNAGPGRAGNAPCYHPDADSVLIAQISTSINGLIRYCATLASYRDKDNSSAATNLIVELTGFVRMIKSAHDLATFHMLARESEHKLTEKLAASEKKLQEALVCDEMFSLFGKSKPSLFKGKLCPLPRRLSRI